MVSAVRKAVEFAVDSCSCVSGLDHKKTVEQGHGHLHIDRDFFAVESHGMLICKHVSGTVCSNPNND